MKKRVKVYKSADGTGMYNSNLAKFIQKAQMGGQPTMDQLSYPGEQQQQGEQIDQDQVINMVAMDITSGRPKEETMAKLTNIVGLDIQTADKFFESVRTQINSRKEDVEEEIVEEEETPADPSGNQQIVEKEDEDEEEEEGPSNNDIAYQDALNDDSDEAVMEGDVEGMFQMGGDVSADFGDQYSVTLPDVSAYLPTDMYNMWDPSAQLAWNEQMYMSPEEQEVDTSYTDPAEEEVAKYGGSKKVKKAYVNAILRANKKQMGGDSVSEESDADATGQNYRTAKLKGFVGTLKNNATESLLRQQAEQEFDQMMQDGGDANIYQGQDFENPMHHLEALSNATGNIFEKPMTQVNRAQFGGFLERFRNRNQQAPNMGFMQRKGFINPMLPIESIDVRRSGKLFGRPKEYTVTFGRPTLPGGANSVYPGSFYGYGYPGMASTTQTKKVVTKGTIINEAATVNNQEASKEVAKNTPQSDATQKSAEETKQAEGTTTTNTGGGGGGATTTTNKTNQPIAPKVTSKTIKRDSWGRPEGNKWFGFDPVQKRYTEGPNFQPLTTRRPNATPGLSNIQQGIENYVTPKSREEAIATNQQYFVNQRANAFQPKGMLVDAEMGPFGRETPSQEKVAQAKQQVAIQKEAAKVKKGDTSNLTDAQIKALRLNYSRPGEAAKLKKSNPNLYKTLFGQEEGGIIDFDQLQNMDYLQRFIYGGYDPSIADLTESQIDYSDSKDVTDPYFQYGGVNEITGIRNDKGQQMQGYVRPDGTYIKDITVNKVGMLGRPKQYSVTYGLSNEAKDPTAAQFTLNKPGENKDADTKKETVPQASTTNSDTRTNTEGLDFKTARAIRKGERQSERQRARGERRFGTPEEQAQEYYRANPEQLLPIRNAQSELNKLITRGPQQISTLDEIRNQINMDYLPARARHYDPTDPTNYQEYPEWFDESGKPRDNAGLLWDSLLIEPGAEDYIFYENGGSFIGANPVVYTDNPALVGQSNVDMITLNSGIQGQGQINWADLNNDRGFDLQQPTQYVQDPTQINRDQAQRAYSGDVTVDVRNRLSNDQLQAGMNLANAGIRGITGMKNRLDDARIARDFYDNFTADNLYASDPSRDRGDYAESGLYRPDEQGQVWSGRSKQYGGDISFGEDPDYVEGDEVYMTDDEIRQYMANGGQVEYI